MGLLEGITCSFELLVEPRVTKFFQSVSMYHIHKMMGKSFQIPWEEYSDEERQGCFEEIETMFRVITKKTVTRAGLELLIPWLLDPQNHARRKDVEDRKAAGKRNDRIIYMC